MVMQPNNYLKFAAKLWMPVGILVMTTTLAGCNHPDTSVAPKAQQRSFAAPADAGEAIFQAAKAGDEAAMLAIFGPDAKDVLFTGDPVKDKGNFQDFAAAYSQMNRWVKIKAGGEVLNIGADNHPFPVPLDKNPSGQWVFDTAAGRDEILARRIGKDELTAIGACEMIVDAQKQYFSQTHDGDKTKHYAQMFASNEGKHDGLYWPVEEGQPASPLGLLGDFAKAAGYTNTKSQPQPFDGYYFHILSKQGGQAKGGAKNYLMADKMTAGFAVIAYPTAYRDSGIMTFLVNADGIVYQKDLGEKTTEIASTMDEYNPGDGWTPVSE